MGRGRGHKLHRSGINLAGNAALKRGPPQLCAVCRVLCAVCFVLRAVCCTQGTSLSVRQVELVVEHPFVRGDVLVNTISRHQAICSNRM